jgi:hypothetical protein
MALEKIFEKEFQNIDNEARIKKEVVFYFKDLINSNYQEITNVFFPIIEKEFKNNENLESEVDSVKQEFFEKRLYVEVSKMIKELNSMTKKVIGITMYEDTIQTPDVQLGFSEYFKYKGFEKVSKKLTEKGINEINSYSAVAGLLSIEESRKKSRKMLKMAKVKFRQYK